MTDILSTVTLPGEVYVSFTGTTTITRTTRITRTTKPIEDYPAFPSTWKLPSSCANMRRYYRVIVSSDSTANMWGTPTPYTTGNTPSGDCFPPSFTVDAPYRTDGDCPSGYKRACARGIMKEKGEPQTSYVTCCPQYDAPFQRTRR